MLSVDVRHVRGCAVCALDGEVDVRSAPDFRSVIADVVGEARVVIDLSATAFMDSAGLGALIGAIRRVREAGGEPAIVCARSSLHGLLGTTGVDRVVLVVGSLEEAVDALERTVVLGR